MMIIFKSLKSSILICILFLILFTTLISAQPLKTDSITNSNNFNFENSNGYYDNSYGLMNKSKSDIGGITNNFIDDVISNFVICPITLTPDSNSIYLGWINPDGFKDVSNQPMYFDVTGGNGWPFELTTKVGSQVINGRHIASSFNGGPNVPGDLDNVYITGGKWYYNNNFIGNGDVQNYQLQLSGTPGMFDLVHDQNGGWTQPAYDQDSWNFGNPCGDRTSNACQGEGLIKYTPGLIWASPDADEGYYTWDIFLNVDYLTFVSKAKNNSLFSYVPQNNDLLNDYSHDESIGTYTAFVICKIYGETETSGYYPFNGTANDESGNGNNCIVYGATLSTDRFGNANKAYSFDGQDDYIDGIMNNNFKSLHDFSVSCWFKPNDGGSNQQVILNNHFGAIDYFPTSNEISIRIYSDRNGCLNSNTQYVWTFDVGNIKNDWNHVVFLGFQDNTAKFYLNGNEISIGLRWVDNGVGGNYNGFTISSIYDTKHNSRNHFFIGKIDDIRIYPRTLNEDEVMELYYEGDDLKRGLIAYYPFNGNANDESGNGNNAINHGAILTTDRFGVAGNAYYFYNTFMEIPNSQDICPQNLTISIWIKQDSYQTNDSPSAISKRYIEGNLWNSYNITGYAKSSTEKNIVYFQSNSHKQLSVGAPIFSGQWTQIVVSYDGTLLKFYVDGILKSSSPFSGQIVYNDSPLLLAKTSPYYPGYWYGAIDDFRIYNRALNDTEVTALYNAEKPTSNVDLENGLIAYYPFNGNANDESGNGNNGIVNGATLTTDRFGNSNKAYNFDGQDDYINITDNAMLRPDHFTISVWYYTDYNYYYQCLLSKSNRTTAANEQFFFDFQDYGLKLNSNCSANQGWRYYRTDNHDMFSLDKWVHIVVSWDGNTQKVYKNGKLLSGYTWGPSADLTGPLDDCAGGDLRIGHWWAMDPKWFNGKLDDIRIYNRALNEAEVMELYKFNLIPTIIKPNISLSSNDILVGHDVLLSGSGFSKNSEVKIDVYSEGFNEELKYTVQTNGEGKFDRVLHTSTFEEGYYQVDAIDKTTFTKRSKIFQVYQPTQEPLIIEYLSPSSEKKLVAGNPEKIKWSFILFRDENLLKSVSRRSFNFKIEYSSNDGITWNFIGEKLGDHPIGYEFDSEMDFIPNNPGIYIFRISETLTSKVVISKPITVVEAINGEIKIDFKWDNSSYDHYPIDPKGVAAEGTSRFLISVYDNSIYSKNITKVELYLDDGNSNESTYLGKLLKASHIKYYSDEANIATEILQYNDEPVFDSGEKLNKFWFWYVAPDDFVRNPSDETKSIRYVNLRAKIYYVDGSEKYQFKQIEIVRPPLLLVHGLGGDNTIWDKVNYLIDNQKNYLVNDKRFTLINAPTLRNLFMKNYLSIESQANALFGSRLENFENVLGTIHTMRRLGYSCSKVDYIGYSMGSNVLRYAEENLKDKFYININYKKGFINKFISIDSPHDGSFMAYLLCKYLPNLDYKMKLFAFGADELFDALNLLTRNSKVSTNFDLSNFYFWNEKYNRYEPSEAVRDLNSKADDKNHGIKFGQCNIKTHLIYCDWIPGDQSSLNDYSIPNEWIEILSHYKEWFDFIDILFKAGILKEEDKAFVKDIKSILEDNSDVNEYLGTINKIKNVLSMLELLSDFYNMGLALPESDLFVSLNSQSSNIHSNFSNLSKISSEGFNLVWHLNCFQDQRVGQKIIELLNESIFSDQFGNINATNVNQEINRFNKKNSNNLQEETSTFTSFRIDTNIVKILNPYSGDKISSNEKVKFTIEIKDTAELVTLSLYFQGEIYPIKITNDTIVFNLLAKATHLDKQMAYIEAYYIKEDSLLFIYDSVSVQINKDEEIKSISAYPNIVIFDNNQPIEPTFYIHYQSYISNLSPFFNKFNIEIDNENIVEYNKENNYLIPKKVGETYGIFSYKGYVDTFSIIVISVVPQPANAPELIYPFNNTIIRIDTSNFYWGSVKNTLAYKMQVSENDTFEDFVLDNNYSSDTAKKFYTLNPGTKYYWRVKAIGIGGESDWSDVWSFKTIDPAKYLYVDDDWSSSEYGAKVDDGKYYRINAFDNIQEALDSAVHGTTIYIADGNYNIDHSLILDKDSISIIGNGWENRTNLDFSSSVGNAIKVVTDGITLKKFRIIPPKDEIAVYASNFPNIINGFTIDSLYVDAGRNTDYYFKGVDNLTLTNTTIQSVPNADGVTLISCQNAHISDNNIASNCESGIGIYCSSGFLPEIDAMRTNSEIFINHNRIYSNWKWGIKNTTDDIVNAQNNWWGDINGPYNPELNPLGKGDKIRKNVDFVPWTLTTDGIYDLRHVEGKSYVTDVKEQDFNVPTTNYGVISGLESYLLLNDENISNDIDFSEGHMALLIGEQSSLYHVNNYLTLLQGPVDDKEFKLEKEKINKKYRVNYLFDEFLPYPCAGSENQSDCLKDYIFNYGPVVAGVDLNINNAFNDIDHTYRNVNEQTTHDVSIVGWDDYKIVSINNDFSVGAYIAKNSYGSNWISGDRGYFFIAYDDPAIYNESGLWSHFSPTNLSLYVLHHDELLSTPGFLSLPDRNSIKFIVHFTDVKNKDILNSLGMWVLNKSASIQFEIYDDFNDKSDQLIKCLYVSDIKNIETYGYYAMPINGEISDIKNNDVYVLITIKSFDGNVKLPIASNEKDKIKNNTYWLENEDENQSHWIDYEDNDLPVRLYVKPSKVKDNYIYKNSPKSKLIKQDATGSCINAFYNINNNSIEGSISLDYEDNGNLLLVNSYGNILKDINSVDIKAGNDYRFYLSCSSLSRGLYFVIYKSNVSWLVQKVLIY